MTGSRLPAAARYQECGSKFCASGQRLDRDRPEITERRESVSACPVLVRLARGEPYCFRAVFLDTCLRPMSRTGARPLRDYRGPACPGPFA